MYDILIQVGFIVPTPKPEVSSPTFSKSGGKKKKITLLCACTVTVVILTERVDALVMRRADMELCGRVLSIFLGGLAFELGGDYCHRMETKKQEDVLCDIVPIQILVKEINCNFDLPNPQTTCW